MINSNDQTISLTKQCKLLLLSKSSWYYTPKSESEFNQSLIRKIDEQFLITPYYGSRQMSRHFKRQGDLVGRKRIRRLMRIMGLKTIYQSPRTSMPNTEHKIYPYLLKGLSIQSSNQVWCTDITYIPIKRGFMYLVAIMDWHSRKVLSYRFSNTLDASFCVDALKDAIEKYGPPKIFNSDQGSQFTSTNFTKVLKDYSIDISMDGKGRWIDNVMIERLWRSLKYECVYLNNLDNMGTAKSQIKSWMDYYNKTRPHSTFDGQTPHEIYLRSGGQELTSEFGNKLAA